MATAITRLSIDEFLAIEDDGFHDFHELHGGEVVEVPSPSVGHILLQILMERLLTALFTHLDVQVIREFFYSLPGEARRADVAVVKRSQIDEQRDRIFFGELLLVIEILSPSNKHMDLDHIREVCFAHGTSHFCIVNTEFQTVLVYRPHRKVQLFGSGDSIPLDEFGVKERLAVDSIFAW